MNKSTLSLVILALAAAPLATQAAPGGPNAAVNACVKAFVSTYLPNHPVKATNTTGFRTPTSIALRQPRKYTIALSAVGARSGEVLAEARCIADHEGIVLVLDQPPTNYVARADFIAKLY